MAKEIKPFEFKKGQSGNPNGRPKGSLNTKTILERFLSIEKNMINPLTMQKENLSIAELMALRQINNALNGELPAYKEIIDRMEGKATNQIDITTGGEKINTPKPDLSKLSTATLLELQKSFTDDGNRPK
jgi:hypothetical protein